MIISVDHTHFFSSDILWEMNIHTWCDNLIVEYSLKLRIRKDTLNCFIIFRLDFSIEPQIQHMACWG